MTSLILLLLSAIPAAYMHCHDHGKFKGWGNSEGFFGIHQYRRKWSISTGPGFRILTPISYDDHAYDNWYNRFFKLKYKERFPFSATFLVALTDAYHASQFLMRALMTTSLVLAISWPFWWVFIIWAAYASIHALVYKLLSR